MQQSLEYCIAKKKSTNHEISMFVCTQWNDSVHLQNLIVIIYPPSPYYTLYSESTLNTNTDFEFSANGQEEVIN